MLARRCNVADPAEDRTLITAPDVGATNKPHRMKCCTSSPTLSPHQTDTPTKFEVICVELWALFSADSASFFPSWWQINATRLLPFTLAHMFCTECATVLTFLTWSFVLITFLPVLCCRHHRHQSAADPCSVTGRNKSSFNICREL